MEEPTLAQFDLTEADYQRYERFEDRVAPRVLTWLLALGAVCGAVYGLILGGMSVVAPIAILLFAAMGFAYVFLPMLILYALWRPLAGLIIPKMRRYAQFLQARDKYKAWELRTHVDFWRSMPGRAFERELGAAFSRQEFAVEVTPVSGDQGIDIILRRGGRKTIVQCKATAKPVGPAIVRELYGTLHACGADDAILAATGGVTAGVREFIRGKPIRVMTLTDIIRLHRDRSLDSGALAPGA
jgi:hypothetical protein